MFKTLKRILIGSLSILGISTLVWIVLLANPTLSYAHKTQFDQVTVYHNDVLEPETEIIIKNAMNLIKASAIYDPKLNIQLCLNDDKVYPNLHPTPGGSAYAFFNKTVIYASEPNFQQNTTEFSWAVNNYELRKFNLTELLAHEFTHNLQYNADPKFQIKNSIGQIFWIFEGHADYVARGFKNDGKLNEKIEQYLIEKDKAHVGVPVFKLDDGTIQNLSYFKYALVYQYLAEVKNLSYEEICQLDHDLEVHYAEMVAWHAQVLPQ